MAEENPEIKEEDVKVEDPELEDEEIDDDKDSTEEDEEKEDKEEEVLARVDYKDIVKEFPDLFKKHPTLKHAFFREQQFSEVFPTVEEAKKALDAQTAYEEITEAVLSGDAGKFIKELASENREGLENFSKNFLPSLRETSKDIYLDTVTPVVAQYIRNVYSHGASEKDDNIKNAAKIVHKILFGGAYEDIEKDAPLVSKERSKDEEKLEKDKQNYLNSKYQDLYKQVTSECYSGLEKEIDKGLDDLSKTKPGLKKLLAKDIKARVFEEMEKDKNYLSRMETLWKRESRNAFSGTHRNSFLTTFLGKAKAIIPKLRAEARKEALGKEDINGNEKEVNRISGGKRSSGSGKKMTIERVRTEGLTTKGIFDAD
jgi:hypothetical protein